MRSFPIPAPAFDGRSRVVGIEAVFAWLRLGWNLFMVQPVVWMASALILIVGMLALMVVWLIGTLLAGLLAPVLAAGLLTMCRKAASGEAVGLSDLAAGFSMRTASLILLGVISMLAMLAIQVVVFVLFSGSVFGGLLVSGAAGLGVLLGGSIVALLLSSLLFIPLSMALWFAPALVLFNDMSPTEACKASFSASLKNLLPLLLLGLIVFVLGFFAALPAGLGFLVLVPVLAGTAYASWQDVFVAH
jgi:uncharacterized membrane protein